MGAETFRKIATYCKELGVEYLTVYAFSTENWKRPADEVNTIMGLLKQYMLEAIDSMERDQIRLRFLGDMSALSPELQALARAHQRDILPHSGLSGQRLPELRRPGRAAAGGPALCRRLRGGPLPPGGAGWRSDFSGYLYYGRDLPDPELIIRTSGEERLSGFLLWQCAYSELYFCDTLWPDFDEPERSWTGPSSAYQQRDRRFGGMNIERISI